MAYREVVDLDEVNANAAQWRQDMDKYMTELEATGGKPLRPLPKMKRARSIKLPVEDEDED